MIQKPDKYEEMLEEDEQMESDLVNKYSLMGLEHNARNTYLSDVDIKTIEDLPIEKA